MRQAWFVMWMAAMLGWQAAGGAEPASPEGLILESVEPTGMITLTRAEVLAVVRARPGLPFNAEQVAEDTRRIAGLAAVESAYYNTEIVNGSVRLTYVVVERNLVRSIAFSGNRKLSDSYLARQLTFKLGDYLDVFAVRGGVEAITEAYKKKGYPWVNVTLNETAALGHVEYVIEEGAHPKVTKVVFDGAASLPVRELAGAIKTKPKKLLIFQVYFSPDQLEEDTRTLIDIYHKKSFLDVRVANAVEFDDDKSKAWVTFTIEEGPAYIVHQIKYTGNEFLAEEKLLEGLKLRQDYYFSEAWADFDAKKIKSKYAEQGFIDAEVVQNRTFLPDARVDVEFQITQGERYRIGQVTITGNQTLQDRTIRRVLDEEEFTPGQWYNADIAPGTGEGELERIVRQTVITESTVITPVGEDPNTRDALVTIKEGQTGSVMVGAGVASDAGVIGQIVYDQRNFDYTDWPDSWGEMFTGQAFRGAGQRLRLSASPGTEYSMYAVNFTEPYLFDRPMALNLGGSLFDRIRESYDESRTSGTFGLDKRYDDDWRRGISFRAENVTVGNLESDAPPEIFEVRGNNMLYGTRFYIGRDTTDNRYLPTRGYNFDLGYEQVTGDFTFGLLTGTQRWYKTLHEDLSENKTVLETKFRAGTTIGDAPPFEKFYLGGIGSMRGFDYRGISPRSGPSDDPIGSDWMAMGNFEVSVPLGSQTFSWLFFTDIGTIDDGFIRSSIGTGVQILIPQFFGPVPMRFELAAPITKDEQDETQVFSFSVGALF
ncbi:MAG: outer membrane protein assembly factor BamA [Planctomycetaceae bacterium]|nr:outer membrane protein assembly factor BamA [Planctomycetaceae bacterium]